jgi:hypothetical protein
MINKDSIFYSTKNEEEVLEKCGLYEQRFDYRIGIYNQNNVVVDTIKDYKKAEELKLLIYPVWDDNYHYSYNNSLNTHACYLPFFIYLCDNIVKLNIDPKYGPKK